METDTRLRVSKHHKFITVWKAVSDESWTYGLEEDYKIHPTIWSEKVKINCFIKKINYLYHVT